MKIFSFFILSLLLLSVTACNKDTKALDIQKPFTYDDQYYANLKAYKQTNHQMFYGYYAAYAPIAGATGNKESASWGERIMGLPDSLDIVNLWMGIPTKDWQPLALSDMQYCREKKGTRFVAHMDASNISKFVRAPGDTVAIKDSASIVAYGQYVIDQVNNNNIDGVDFDYEPSSGVWTTSNNFVILIKYVGQSFGAMGKDPSKLLCIDFYSSNPPAATGQYASYFVRQAYSQGTGGVQNATNLQNYYNSNAAAIPPGKFIVQENFGDFSANGGTPFTEANGNTLTTDGTQMYSMEGMARWSPTQGKKAGFGAFYFDRDYYSSMGPYYNVRRCIQIVNPAAH
ncbi:glycoside hydrolase family 18 [Pinibacter soli]|uniref:Glycoside hydrolase family 18 n=1 Tax=Pinibacter soli TaxID=3044211 RepID=A0ABT6R6V3_9BACT|nr:glycoside hydrolase family 18 [Pinibacter soli]MDI3318135.1 glycoside hydrolase family 18 [Pinibacter soli]